MMKSIIEFTYILSNASAINNPVDLGDALRGGGVNSLFQTLATLLIRLPFIIFPSMIIFGGIMYMISAGNEQNLKKAQATITWGIIGFLITMLAFGMVKLVINLFNPNPHIDPTTLPQPAF